MATSPRRSRLSGIVRESSRVPVTLNAVAQGGPAPATALMRLRKAAGIVAHAGTGTIIAALQLGKPVLVLPRRADLGETRNDHQFATARHFEQAGRIMVANNENEIAAKMSDLDAFRPSELLGDVASPELTERIRRFIAAA